MTLNASFGVSGLNQAWTRPTLTRGQQGLFNMFNESFAPTVDLGDPESIRKRAQYAANIGDQAKAANLTDMANEAEERQALAREQNIRKTYQAALASGRGPQFEKTMIEAGYADLIGDIKVENIQREVAMVTGNAALDKAEVEKYQKAFYNAKSEAGQAVIIDNLIEQGKGDIARIILDQEDERQLKMSRNELAMQEVKDKQVSRQLDAMPIPLSQRAIEAQRASVPDEYKDYYDARVARTLEQRKKVDDFFKDSRDVTNREMPESLLEEAGFTKEKYEEYVKGFGRSAANRMIGKIISDRPKSSTSLRIPSATTMRTAMKLAEEYVKKNWRGRISAEQEIVQTRLAEAAASLYTNGEFDTIQQAMDAVVAETQRQAASQE